MKILRPSKSSSTSALQSLRASSSSFYGDLASNAASKSKKSSLFSLLLAVLFIGGCLILLQESRYLDSGATENNRAAICAIQKGGLRYLDEWVQYHINAMGFDSIHLYDNSEEFELQGWHQALSQNLQQKIHIRHLPGPKRQNKAYTHCAHQIQSDKKHSWIAFIDIDEFIVLRNPIKYPYIGDLLQSLPPDYGGLAMNWVSIHLNNQTYYQDLPVTLRFPNRSQDALNPHIKTIARTQFLRKVSNPHFVDYSFFRWWIHTHDTRGNQVDGPFNPALAEDDIALFHYQTKSLEEYKERCFRGRADVPKKEWAFQMACKSDREILQKFGKVPELIKDDAPWQLLKERVPNYANKYL